MKIGDKVVVQNMPPEDAEQYPYHIAHNLVGRVFVVVSDDPSENNGFANGFPTLGLKVPECAHSIWVSSRWVKPYRIGFLQTMWEVLWGK